MIVERSFEVLQLQKHNKWSLIASKTGELVFNNVKVPKRKLLPNVEGLKGFLSCLNSARYGISWGVIGAAIDCYCTAVQYSKEREFSLGNLLLVPTSAEKLAEFLNPKLQKLNCFLGN